MKVPKKIKHQGPEPDFRSVETLLELASTLIHQGRTEKARRVLNQVLQQTPENRMAHLLLKHVFVMQSDWSGLRMSVEQQLEHRVSPEVVAWNRGLVSLLLGDMPRGWEQFEARWQVPGLVVPERNFTQPRWEGESFTGKTLLLHFEQGLGDTLMFVRYAKQAKALGGRVLLAAQVPLADLVATCPGVDEVIPHSAPLPPFDLHLPLLSLPNVFKTDLASIPAEIPYLDIPESVPNRERMLERSQNQRVRRASAWFGPEIELIRATRRDPSPLLLSKYSGPCPVSLGTASRLIRQNSHSFLASYPLIPCCGTYRARPMPLAAWTCSSRSILPWRIFPEP